MGTLWIVADAHGGADPRVDASLLKLLDAALDASADLLILGDLFMVWGGPERFLTAFQAEVMGRLRRARDEGQRVTFVVGNRDYLVRQGQLGRAFDRVIEHEALVDIGGVPTLVAHGDRINPDDRLYQTWYRLSRNRISERLLLSTPPPIATRLATRIEAAMRNTNKKYKTGRLPEAAIQGYGKHAAAAGAARALLGHFHADTTIETAGVPVVIAPAWLDHEKIMVVEADGSLVSMNPLTS